MFDLAEATRPDILIYTYCCTHACMCTYLDSYQHNLELAHAVPVHHLKTNFDAKTF